VKIAYYRYKRGNVRINLTMRRVLAVIVAVEKRISIVYSDCLKRY